MTRLLILTLDRQMFADAAAVAAKNHLSAELATPREKLPAVPAALVYDADTAAADPDGVGALVGLLLAEPVTDPVGLLGYAFSDAQFAALERHGVVVSREPDHRFFTRLAHRVGDHASRAA